MLSVFLILEAIVLAQPSPPALGVQIGYPSDGYDIRFPLTAVTQCESVFIYYNFTDSDPHFLHFIQLDLNVFLHVGPFSPNPEDINGVGYIEWICNIHGFGADFSGYLRRPVYVVHPVVVQPGSLSSCLYNVTATYQYAVYYTSICSPILRVQLQPHTLFRLCSLRRTFASHP